ATTGEPVTPPLRHSRPVARAAFSRDGRRVITASSDQTVRIWDLVTASPLPVALWNPAAVPVQAVVFSPDGRRLLSSTGTSKFYYSSGEARVWDTATGLPVSPPLHQGSAVVSAAFTPDGGRVATAIRKLAGTVEECEVRVWDTATGRAVGPLLKFDS